MNLVNKIQNAINNQNKYKSSINESLDMFSHELADQNLYKYFKPIEYVFSIPSNSLMKNESIDVTTDLENDKQLHFILTKSSASDATVSVKLEEGKYSCYIKLQVDPNPFWTIKNINRIEKMRIESDNKEISQLRIFDKIKPTKEAVKFEILIWKIDKNFENYIKRINSDILNKIVENKEKFEVSLCSEEI